MDLTLTDDQQSVREAFARFFAKECPPERVRAAESPETGPIGFDRPLWEHLVEMGAVSMALETGLLDLALVAEQFGRVLAPVPLVEAVVAARVTGRAEAGSLVTFAPRAAAGGRAEIVPGGAVADAVVALDGADLVLARLGPGPRPAPPNLATEPVAGCELAERDVLASGADAVARFERARDEWRALTAAAFTGLAERALEIGVDYVRARHQFGRPIGQFQAVQHRLADVATALDGARLLAYEAASAFDEHRPDAGALACMAFLHCGDTAYRSASESLHFHGGYGFMLEYDVQLYFRRAAAWRLLGGSLHEQWQVLADRLFGEVGSR